MKARAICRLAGAFLTLTAWVAASGALTTGSQSAAPRAITGERYFADGGGPAPVPIPMDAFAEASCET